MTCTVGHFYRLFHLGLACRPTDSFIVLLLAVFSERRQSWPGGLVSLAWWLGLFFAVCFCFGAIVSQCF